VKSQQTREKARAEKIVCRIGTALMNQQWSTIVARYFGVMWRLSLGPHCRAKSLEPTSSMALEVPTSVLELGPETD
jgi:hypothetical protein